MQPRGITHRLQGYVPTLADTAANGFDLAAWQQATGLQHFGVELIVHSGAVSVSLLHITPDGIAHDFARLDCDAAGSAFSPPITLHDHAGVFLPRLISATPEAEFEIYFGTEDPPPDRFLNIAYVLAGDPDCAPAIAAFQSFVQDCRQRGDPHNSRLLAVQSKPQTADPGPEFHHPAITRLTCRDTTAAIGHGLYQACYGAVANETFTHVCLIGNGILPDPEMFARTAVFLRYMQPGFHLAAQLYQNAETGGARPADLPMAENWLSPPTAGFPRQPAAPSDVDLSQPAEQPAEQPPEQPAGPLGWHWLCLDIRDIHRIALPYPFPGDLAGQEYEARVQALGSRRIMPASFWISPPSGVAADIAAVSAADPDTGLRHRWASMAMQERLPEPQVMAAEFGALVNAQLAEGKLGDAHMLIANMAAFLDGPEALMPPRIAPAQSPPPALDGLRWRLHRLQVQLDRLPALIARYGAARQRRSTASYWARMAGTGSQSDIVQADISLTAPGPNQDLNQDPKQAQNQSRDQDALRQHHELATSHLRLDALRRRQEATQQQLADFEQRLQHNQLLDPVRALADQDRVNRTMLSLLRNRHAGQRAFVIGNGPSLRISDLDRLHREVCFAANKIYLAYDATSWRPTYYSVEDHLVIENNRAQIEALTGSIKIFPSNVRDFAYHAADTIFVPSRPPRSYEEPLSDPDFPDFSDDLSHGICWGSTVVYSQIQMALFMGCSEIYLIGVDHAYQLPSQKIGAVYLHAGEQNHFHPEYRKPGERWHQPNLAVLEVSYDRARTHCAARGVPIYNASRQSQLAVFERVAFDDLFPGLDPEEPLPAMPATPPIGKQNP